MTNQVATFSKHSLYIQGSNAGLLTCLGWSNPFFKATALGLFFFFNVVFFYTVFWKWELLTLETSTFDNKGWRFCCCCSTSFFMWNSDVPSLKISPRNMDSSFWRNLGNSRNSSSSETSPSATWSSYKHCFENESPSIYI